MSICVVSEYVEVVHALGSSVRTVCKRQGKERIV